MITSVEHLFSLLSKFSLEQNFPNPFNPITTITLSLPSRLFVSLKILDALGRQIATLVSGELSAGTYTKQWNGSNTSSGVYFYRLQVGPFRETKNFILLR
jgi:hypothetical protein